MTSLILDARTLSIARVARYKSRAFDGRRIPPAMLLCTR